MVHGEGGVRFQNWARTYGSSPEMHFQPTTVDEIREILALARQKSKKVKVVGGGHSPSDIACTEDFMIQMGRMNKILEVKGSGTGLGAVSDVAAAGVIGTGTHNTGFSHGILATQVVAMTLLTAAGDILECSETVNPELFRAACVHLGCLGIVLTITFQCVAEFYLQETTFPSTLKEVLDNLDNHLKKSEYFRFLWFPHSDNVSIIYQDHTNKLSLMTSSIDSPVPTTTTTVLAASANAFLPFLVSWINRFFFWLLFTGKVENVNVSYKIFNYECRFKQHVQDWAIPLEKTKDALLELKGILETNPKMVAHYPVEVRFTQGDDFLLSPCFQRNSCYINIIMYR
ncbi:PREDICTED: L-gulonolactone oxidase-like [Thamnophis sirtalis]|uniref:L-gulonolactone oxidase n=1 Tax=Thamnophis sirtalis TaxID=35019 RepID=A0A6I9YSG3_9SAUR|nr:PREDICTED: L-gulonolactone oxidase-like [Thamnophis sirtalis]